MAAAVPDYKTYLDYVFPLPNQTYNPAASVGLFIGAFPRSFGENHADARWDALLAGNSNLSVSYSRSRQTEDTFRLLDPYRRTGKQERVN